MKLVVLQGDTPDDVAAAVQAALARIEELNAEILAAAAKKHVAVDVSSCSAADSSLCAR